MGLSALSKSEKNDYSGIGGLLILIGGICRLPCLSSSFHVFSAPDYTRMDRDRPDGLDRTICGQMDLRIHDYRSDSLHSLWNYSHEKKAIKREIRGEIYYFCSKECADRFEEEMIY